MKRILQGDWNYPTRMLVGPDRIVELSGACRDLGLDRPLLVTDAGLAAHPMIAAALERLAVDGLSCRLFGSVHGNPTGADVAAGVAAYADGGHNGVIGFGGGSAIDAAKAVALMVGQDRPIWDFEDVGDNWTRVDAAAIPPIVAVPTTAGTGSEVGRASVIVNEADHHKTIIFHPKMMPSVVISDPVLTIGLPPAITAATGLDAFVHCFEAFCAPGYHPMADAIALEGMRLIAEALPKAFHDGTDLGARADMLSAASMGATAFQKGLGGVHAIAHAVGGLYNTHHGLTNAVLLPYVIAANAPAIAGRLPHLQRTLGLASAEASVFLDWVLAFRRALGIPETLGEIGVDGERAEQIGRIAVADPSAAGNPVATDAAGYQMLFENAVSGKLEF